MDIRMTNLERLTLAEMAEFVASNQGVDWQAIDHERVYGFVERVLKHQRYSRLRKSQRGIVRAFLLRITGLSRAQVTRLIQRWMQMRQIERKRGRRPSFKRRYTEVTCPRFLYQSKFGKLRFQDTPDPLSRRDARR
jgi:hypothetical protein